MESGSLRGLLTDELATLLSVEAQVLQALPVLRSGLSTDELAAVILSDVTETKQNIASLESVLKLLHRKREALPEPATRAILEACSSILKRFAKGNLRDAALLAVLQRLEHYRYALYLSTFALAKHLGEQEVLNLLKQGAARDDLTSRRFGQIAIQVNAEAFMDTHSEHCEPVIALQGGS